MIPVTVLCGGLGAGKTTLLTRLLEDGEREIAVVVNDVGAVNVDADLVAARTALGGREVLALENGCICCGLGDELSRSVIELWKRHEFDALVVEASGVSEPEPIARTFVRGPAGGPYELDTLVTVVDARAFHDAFAGEGEPSRAGPDETGSKPLADLWLEQVEFCDLLVVNKCDLVSADEREAVIALLEGLQPRAELVTTEYGCVDPDRLLATGRFDHEAVRESAGWKRAVEVGVGDGAGRDDGDSGDGHDHDHDHDSHHDRDHDDDSDHHDRDHDHSHPPEEYGVEVWSYRRDRPFHPERLADELATLPPELVRAKGLCWIAGRERVAITASVARGVTTLEATGRWIASLPETQRAAHRRGQPDLPWDEEWGDREIRLAIIGRGLDRETFEDRLDDCLLTDDETAADWSAFENPAPTSMGGTVIVGSSGDEIPDG